MNYFIKRGEEKYGPYSLADLQRYVQSGNIALGDLAQSEGMSDWIPVSQVIGNIPVPITTPAVGTVAVPAQEPTVPLPPDLHWVLVLIISWVTCGLFSIVWGFMLAVWAKKLDRDNKSTIFMLIYAGAIIVGTVLAFGDETARGLGLFLRLGGVICYLIGAFGIKASMEAYYTTTENIGLSLSGVMTFFFNIVYFQYHINRIHRWKRTGVLS